LNSTETLVVGETSWHQSVHLPYSMYGIYRDVRSLVSTQRNFIQEVAMAMYLAQPIRNIMLSKMQEQSEMLLHSDL